MQKRNAHHAAFWADPQIHPAAEALPMMSDAEIRELADDIKANGLQEPLVVFEDNTEAAHGDDDPFACYPLSLLDGRNRLAALKLLGITDPNDAPKGRGTPERLVRYVRPLMRTATFGRRGLSKPQWKADVDPAKFVQSLNVYRRHLTSEQKRDVITAYLKIDPTASDRKIARKVGVDNKTAAKVRKEMEEREEIPHAETRTDSAGRKQPASKPGPRPDAPVPNGTPDEGAESDALAEELIAAATPGGLTETSPGQTDRVSAALTAARERKPITGTDGKTYPQKPDVPKPPSPGAKVLADAKVIAATITAMTADMDTLNERICKLYAADRALNAGYRKKDEIDELIFGPLEDLQNAYARLMR